jgi:hypothetical protein
MLFYKTKTIRRKSLYENESEVCTALIIYCTGIHITNNCLIGAGYLVISPHRA